MMAQPLSCWLMTSWIYFSMKLCGYLAGHLLLCRASNSADTAAHTSCED